jgi:PAS domain S-box-containing protein
VESSDDAIFACTPEGIVSSWNAGAQRIFGYPARELIGRPAFVLAPTHRHEIGSSILAKALAGELVRGHETQWLTRAGEPVDLSMTVSPMRDPSDAIVGVSVVARDVTAKKRARAEAEQVKEQFFSLVSHELRTPLASIIGYLEVLREGSAIQLTDEKRDEFLDVLHRNSQRLLRLVGDLLLVSKIQAGSFSITRYPVDLHELALQCVEAAAPVAAAERVGLTLAAEGGVEVEGDPDRLAQVLDNLVVNAVKYTPAGGAIEVRLSSSGGLACFEVVNSGPGIAEDELGRLFEPFFRASNASNDVPGVGLGLVIVKSIVEAHGGQIAVESTPGVDTTFRVTLPLRDPASDAQSQTKEAA